MSNKITNPLLKNHRETIYCELFHVVCVISSEHYYYFYPFLTFLCRNIAFEIVYAEKICYRV